MKNKMRMINIKKSYRLKGAKKEMIFSGLHALLTSGLDLGRAFHLLIEGEGDKGVKALLENAYSSIVKGNALWESFKKLGKFLPLDYGVLRVGEETGRLDEATRFLADYYRKREEQRRMISGAMGYPVVVLLTAIVVFVFMVLVIVPMFEQVYARMGGELPALTRGMMAFADRFPTCLAFFAGMVLTGVMGYFVYGKTDRVQSFFALLLLRCPGVGRLIRETIEARFCKLLYLLYGSGVPLLEAVDMLRDIIFFYPYRRSFVRIGECLQQGALLADALAEFPDLYARKLITLVQVGEETNRLGEMLRKQGDDLSLTIEYQLKQLGTLLEPALILGVGALVALVLVAMYLPMFKLGAIIG